MELKVVEERAIRPLSGFVVLMLLVAGLAASTVLIIRSSMALDDASYSAPTGLFITGLVIGSLGMAACSLGFAGLKVVHPNEAKVFALFGRYHGTVSEAGFFFVNPFCESVRPRYLPAARQKSHGEEADTLSAGAGRAAMASRSISLKLQTLNNGLQKVNDVLGNPIIIGAVVIWRVDRPTQAVFSVENYFEYLGTQTDLTIRNTARLYPYDVFGEDEDDGVHEQTLRGSSLEIAETMQAELQKRVDGAGMVIEEVRITHLAYAEEIAAAMLQRQQAVAIIAARKKIVDGAVGMVKDAIDKLGENDIVVLDDERKASMVSNLLVVLVGNHDAQPIVNTGSIY